MKNFALFVLIYLSCVALCYVFAYFGHWLYWNVL